MLSDEITLGMSNIGKISSNIFFAMAKVFLFLVGKASTKPEKVFTKKQIDIYYCTWLV